MIRLAAFLIALFAATPASADPISTALLLGVGISATTTAVAITTFAIRLAAGFALSALSRALQPKRRDPGLTTKQTLTGDINPTTFILGRSATAGVHIAPPLSHGANHAYLTYIIALGAVPGQTLNRVVVNDEWVALDGTPHAEYGTPPGSGKYAGNLWVKFYDGTQTAADAMLVAKYGSHPDYPWPTTAIGTGVAYAICTFRFNRKLYSGYPTVRFEIDGAPLYDPRHDSTAGGSGSQRWATPSTWAQSDNPVVMVYNLLRGVAISGGADIYGGGVGGTDLPYSSWAAAMATADATVTMAGGGTEPAYRAGFEVRTDEEPLSIIDELLKTASADLVNSGGFWKIRVGAPASSTLAITDDNIIITEDRSFDLFQGLAETHNGITASYPEPAMLYASKEAPQRYNSTWEAEDGSRRLVADLSLPACPYPNQVQRLMRAYIEDERRFRRHTITLPPMALLVEPMDTLSWTSAINGYTSKLFEVASVQEDPGTMLQLVTIRERDAADYSWHSGYEMPAYPATPSVTLAPLSIGTVTLTAGTVTADSGSNFYPTIVITWDGDQPLATAVEWQIRLASSGVQAIAGSTSDVSGGTQTITQGIAPNTAYQVRARLDAPMPTAWSNWLSITTNGVLPPVTTAQLAGAVDLTSYAEGLTGVQVVTALPASGNTEGALAVLTTDGKLYRYAGTAWTAAVPAADVTGQLTNAQIANLAAAKLTGHITTVQITDAGITTPKIAAGAVTANEIAANTIVANNVAARAITTPKIAAGAVTANEIAANAITTSELAANSVTTGAIVAGAIKSGQIYSGAVTAAKMNVTDLSAISANLGTISVTNANIANLTVGTSEITGNAVSQIRSSSGAASITFTPAVSGEVIAWLWCSLHINTIGGYSRTFTLTVNGITEKSAFVSAPDKSPSHVRIDFQTLLIYAGSTVAGTPITISGSGDLIVFETKK